MCKKDTALSVTILILILNRVLGTITLLDKGVMPLVKDSIGIQFYVDLENSDKACRIITKFKTCIVDENKTEDCSIFDINSISSLIMKAHSKKTLTYILPSLYKHDLKGYCHVILDSQCQNIRNKTEFQIPFDTQTSSKDMSSKYLLKDYVGDAIVRTCSFADQDSLKDCAPADCDVKYSGKRPFYSMQLHKCLPETVCIGNPDKELPEVALLVTSNTCRDLEKPLTVQDIYVITTGLAIAARPSENVDTVKVELTSNCSTISQNIHFLRDLAFGKLYPTWNNQTLDYSVYCKSAFFSITISVMIMCAIILLLTFTLNTVVGLFSRNPGDTSKYCDTLTDKLNCFKGKREGNEYAENKETRNALLREVIIKNLPLELRSSAVDICERLGEEVRKKKRYRESDIGSQINLMVNNEDECSDSVSNSSLIKKQLG